MKKGPSAKKKTSSNKKFTYLLLAAIIGVIFIAWLVPTLVVGLIQGDGAANYTGAKQKVAQEAVEAERNQIDNKLRWGYFVRVESVELTTDQEKELYCTPQQSQQVIQKSNDPESIHSYTAKIKVRQVLGFEAKEVTYDGCQLFTKRFGSGARAGTVIDYTKF